MEKKFRFYDPFNDCYSYSDNFDNLCLFFNWYQSAIEVGNNPILEQWTGLHDSTTWKELSEERKKEWLSKAFAPSEWTGIELYENDVIKCDVNYAVVSLENGIFGYKWINSKIPHIPLYRNSQDFKLAGNKNQHLELLKQD